MFTPDEIMQLVQSMIWLLAGVGIFIVGMNFMSEALEKCAGSGSMWATPSKAPPVLKKNI